MLELVLDGVLVLVERCSNNSTMELSIASYKRAFGAPGEVRYEFSDGDTLIGVASVSSNENSYFIHFITVMPENRGKGYGSRILEALCEKFSDKPIWLELDASSPLGLKPLQAWYERHGFIRVLGEYMVREPSLPQFLTE